MILAQGEKMVWAAVFATELRCLREDGWKNGPAGKGAEEEYNICVHGAVESGYEAVMEMRKVAIELQSRLDSTEKKKQRDDDKGELQMLRAMLGDEG